jgi:hypothetical protein
VRQSANLIDKRYHQAGFKARWLNTVPLREISLRKILWSYHNMLGTTLYLLFLLCGAWRVANIRRRPSHIDLVGQAAVAGLQISQAQPMSAMQAVMQHHASLIIGNYGSLTPAISQN